MGKTKKYTLFKAIFRYFLRNFVKLIYIYICLSIYLFISPKLQNLLIAANSSQLKVNFGLKYLIC